MRAGVLAMYLSQLPADTPVAVRIESRDAHGCPDETTTRLDAMVVRDEKVLLVGYERGRSAGDYPI